MYMYIVTGPEYVPTCGYKKVRTHPIFHHGNHAHDHTHTDVSPLCKVCLAVLVCLIFSCFKPSTSYDSELKPLDRFGTNGWVVKPSIGT